MLRVVSEILPPQNSKRIGLLRLICTKLLLIPSNSSGKQSIKLQKVVKCFIEKQNPM